MQKNNTIEVETPMGTLVAYPSIDPNNPGIFIDLKRNGISLNLTGTECQIPEDDDEKPRLVSHIWGCSLLEDPTNTVRHANVDEYFTD